MMKLLMEIMMQGKKKWFILTYLKDLEVLLKQGSQTISC